MVPHAQRKFFPDGVEHTVFSKATYDFGLEELQELRLDFELELRNSRHKAHTQNKVSACLLG